MNWISQNWVEIVSATLGIICVWLNTRASILGWPIGIVSVALAAWVYFQNRLFAEFGLQIFYILSGFYGWWSWQSRSGEMEFKVRTFSAQSLSFQVLSGLILGYSIGYFLQKYTLADWPMVDAQITAFSLIGQIWLARKYLENWILWLAINAISIYLYFEKGLWFFLGLYVVLFILAIKGFRDWKILYQAQNKKYAS